jgi:predicted nucleic acid-binding protein
MKTRWVVVDASYVLDLLLPDEKKIGTKLIHAIAPQLLVFEVTNAIKMAVVRKRITSSIANVLLKEFEGWKIRLMDVRANEVLELALEKDLSVYDASYLYLAEKMKCELLTWDKKLEALAN